MTLFIVYFFALSLLVTSYLNVTQAGVSPFQEEHKSPLLKVVISLDYTQNQYVKGVGQVAVSYEDSDGFKQIKYYDFDKMMHRDSPKPVKVKAKFPRDTVVDYEDYLICVKTLKNNQKNCSGDSRSPGTDKERIHIQIP